MTQTSNWNPIHTRNQYLLPISQYSSLEDQNRQKPCTSHPKLATDDSAPELMLYVAQGGGGGLALIGKSPVNQPKSAGSLFDNPNKAN